MDKTYYLKATGNNRWAGGSYQWLKIRGFKALKNAHSKKEMYELQVKFSGKEQYMMIADPYETQLNVKFKDHTDKPVSFLEVIQHFKDKSIGLLIS